MKILIAEDNDTNRKLLRAVFESEGYRVLEAADGQQALELLEREEVDAIISDILMPRMDGYRLCYEVRKSPRWRHLPFIVYTSTYTSPSDEKLSMDLGADKFMRKPASSETLMKELQKVLKTERRASATIDPPAELTLMKEYTARLVSKLEQKNLELAQRVEELRMTKDQLSQSLEQLRWKTAFLEALVNSSLDGILVVNSQGETILQNEQMLKLWKIPPELAEKEDAKQLEFALSRVKNPKQFAEKVAYLYGHPAEVSRDELELVDGLILERYSSPVLDAKGTNYGRIWTFRDHTERKQLESQLRQAQKMEAIGELAGGVAHDFNNLLAVIRGNAELALMDGEGLPTEATDCLKQVVGASERAANLTQQLLIFSRKQLMQLQVLQFHELVKNLTKMLRRVIPENIDLKCATLEQPSWVKADAGMLEQALLNLVVNARDAMPKGGELVVSIQKMSIGQDYLKSHPEAREGDFIRLQVSDTGTGIATENLPRIFEPFFTTKQPGKGTGLGLATVFGIVKQHKGWLEVESRVGEGSSFKIFLPVVPPPDKVASAAQPEAELRGGTETILLVEDDFAVRMITRQVLETFQYNVYEATSGREALKVWEQHSGEIALLLTDIVMPEGMTGRDLARQLRAQKPQLKVIFMSGYSPEVLGRQTEFFHRTRSQFLRKPFSTQLLVRTLRQTLDQSADG